MPIDPEGSVTQWIADLQVGQADQAEHELWDRYFRRLVGLVRMKLGDAPRIAEDEEDVAVSALRSFYSGVAAGRFPLLEDRHNLWALLAKITACKAINQRNRQLAQKRGGGRVLSEAQIAQPSSMNERQLGTANEYEGSLIAQAGQNFTGYQGTSAEPAGDFDLDCDVDGADFLEWQQHFGSPYMTADLIEWQTNYGTVAPLQSLVTAVPEPSSLVLLLLSLQAFIPRRALVHAIS